ncbi:galactoside O-acetyltransferase [Monaibacterium marinum]|uniref:Galactoside O-acetyltransferase n=1 Tax=Pontivivens marinum TaxID=1690039 RepID=A0A2C9CWB1_9RHOB|nr:acyltransferase [Monaibacterium marinum]SOH95500.1 galactoside O-acetyltransferase [Monaibacterium marinum]
MSNKNPFNAGYFETDELREMGFAQVGDHVRIARGCNIVGLEHISLGAHVRIDFATTIVASAAGVRIGSYVHIGAYCYLSAGAGLIIGNFVNLSQRVSIYTASDTYQGGCFTNPTVPAEYTRVTRAPVHLKDHVLLGSSTVVLPGVTIGIGVSVGALSLIREDLEPWTIHAGIPAQFRGERMQIDPDNSIANTLLGEGGA